MLFLVSEKAHRGGNRERLVFCDKCFNIYSPLQLEFTDHLLKSIGAKRFKQNYFKLLLAKFRFATLAYKYRQNFVDTMLPKHLPLNWFDFHHK